MNRISYSQISMYNECPLRWKLNYVDKISVRESNIFLIFGTAMHEVIQKYLNIMYNDSAKNADKLDLDKMLRDNLIEQFKIAEEEDGKPPCTKEQLMEFFDEGVAIIDFFKKRRNQYFSKRDWELIGCEIPIEVDLKNDIKMVGYLDIVMRHIPTDSIKIMDIKTSTKGWNKWMKADENKTQQLLLYKQFYSKQYNHPIEKIDVEYFILKRQLYENMDFPQKRIQKFSPASGKPSMNKVNVKLIKFIGEAFDGAGEHKNDMVATPSKKACKWCEFKGTEHCEWGK
ncbi:MAG: PD-(D/E)XK nuclease family protein [Candidatus Pelagibacter sp.]|nr:PD-(D/E)XK nuclease family protein [Candidatus Pelagibacter sp.]